MLFLDTQIYLIFLPSPYFFMNEWMTDKIAQYFYIHAYIFLYAIILFLFTPAFHVIANDN